MKFTPAQLSAIAEVAKTFGIEALAMKPGIYLDGISKFIINSNYESDQYNGMPQIGIFGGTNIDESGKQADKVRAAITEAFKILPKEKYQPKVVHDSVKQGQDYIAPKPPLGKVRKLHQMLTGETSCVHCGKPFDEWKDKTMDECIGVKDEPKIETKTQAKAEDIPLSTNVVKPEEPQKVGGVIPHIPEPKQKKPIDDSKCGAIAKKALPVKTCIIKTCGIALSDKRKEECFARDPQEPVFICEECEEKQSQKPEPKQAEVMPFEHKQINRQAPARIPVVSHTPQGTIIKGIAPGLAEIGKIKIGEKGEMKTSAGGVQFRQPVKLDHFKITTIIRDEKTGQFELDPIMKTLGDSPTSLDIQLLFNDPTLNFVTSYGYYEKGRCLCRGDGEYAKMVDGSTVVCNPEACPQFEQKKCKPNGVLSVILSKSPRLGGVYKFRTTSINSIKSILSSMFFLATQTGGVLSMIPLKLTLSPKQVTPIVKGVPTPSTIYVVNIEYAGTVEDLLQKTIEVQTYQSKMRENLVKLEATARNILTAPEAPEDQKDFQEEYYPEQTEVTK